jgi:hypothetical protein
LLDILANLTSNPWFTILAFGITIASILIAVYFGRKGVRSKDPKYRIKSENFVTDFTNRVQDLQVLYKGKPVSNFTRSEVLFWNDGREAIRASDIPTSDPLRISSKENNEILGHTLVRINNEASQFKVIPNGKSDLNFEFIYLNQGDGAIIQVFHSGKSSEDIEVKGSIIGGKKPQYVESSASFFYEKGERKVPPLIALTGGVILIALGISFAYSFLSFNSYLINAFKSAVSSNSTATLLPPSNALVLSSYITYALSPLAVVIFGVMILYSYFTNRVPRGLQEFREIEPEEDSEE